MTATGAAGAAEGRAGWADRKVLVTGLGLSGAAAATALLGLGAAVTVVDAQAGAVQEERAATLRALGAAVSLGDGALGRPPAGTEVVITSPGWPPGHRLLLAAADSQIPVYGEVELAWRLRPPNAAPWLALTGTNGKTTTVRMLAAMLTAAGRRAAAAGNVGRPLVEAVLAEPAYDVLAVELSSFQLHWTHSIRPAAAAILNVAQDHLDWHGSFEAYASDKHRIWRDPVNGGEVHRSEGGWSVRARLAYCPQPRIPVAVGNADDELTAVLLRAAYAQRRVSFTLGVPGRGQFGVADGQLVDRAFQPDADTDTDTDTVVAGVDDVGPAGGHNVANALAAAALARAYGVPPAAVRVGLRGFTPDGHRNAPVAVVSGVSFVDDSKATNPHAAAASLAAYDRVVWIAGGLLKGADVATLVSATAVRMRAAVLLGADRAAIRQALARHAPHVPVVEVAVTETGEVSATVPPAPPGAPARSSQAGGDRAVRAAVTGTGAAGVMSAAVAAAAVLADPGDTVLLAPAAASMDQFRDYAARGDEFAAAVRRLPGAGR